jgi:hypothetical protein
VLSSAEDELVLRIPRIRGRATRPSGVGFKALRNLGIEDADVARMKAYKTLGLTPEEARDAETQLQLRRDRDKRKKALKLLGATEEDIEHAISKEMQVLCRKEAKEKKKKREKKRKVKIAPIYAPFETEKEKKEYMNFIRERDVRNDDVELRNALYRSRTRRNSPMRRRPSMDMTERERVEKSIDEAREESKRFSSSPYKKTRRMSLTPRM